MHCVIAAVRTHVGGGEGRGGFSPTMIMTSACCFVFFSFGIRSSCSLTTPSVKNVARSEGE